MISAKYLYAAIAVYLVGMIGVVVYSKHSVSSIGERNCLQIEKLKTNVREQARFDLTEAKKTLRQLGVDPDSANGKELIRKGGRNARATRARFAAQDCPG